MYRLNNVFWKWCRPNYNSFVATFCQKITRDQDITISDEFRGIELVYIDDVVDSFLKLLESTRPQSRDKFSKVQPVYKITLGELAGKIREFRNIRRTLTVPDLSACRTRCLYATYLSYLEKDDFAYSVEVKRNQRGSLAELIKSKQFGQIFISKTHGGIIRGNHYHNTKTENFCVIQGEAVIRFRHILSKEVLLMT